MRKSNVGRKKGHRKKKNTKLSEVDNTIVNVAEVPGLGWDVINQLPDECIETIFRFLSSPRDRCACSAVCKKWLLLLAHVRGCQFNSFRVAAARAARAAGVLNIIVAINGNGRKHVGKNEEASRCLEAKEANDARLAAMAVGTYAMKLLGKLSVRGGLFPSFTQQRITDFGLHIVSQSFPNLRALSLWDCFKVCSTGLASIANCCHALEKLDISNLPKIDDDGLVPIAKHCPNLSALSLQSCPLVGNRSLQAVANCSSHLESISIVKCPLVGDAGIICVVSQLPKLSKLRLSQLDIGNAALQAIAKHRGSIKMLYLEHLNAITMAGFSWIGFADKLELLSLNSCVGLTDDVLLDAGTGAEARCGYSLDLPIFNCLKQVCIKKCQYLTDVGLTTLTESTNHLHTLKLESCNSITTQGVITSLGHCSRTLKVLEVVRCIQYYSTSTSSREEGDFLYPSLEYLTLNSCTGVDDAFLSRMGPACTNVTDIALIRLCSITDKGLISLLKQTMSSAVTPPASVNLSGCVGITDWSVLALAKTFKERLELLCLEGCIGLGDRSLQVIGDMCPRLVELDVSGCVKISDDGVVRLAMTNHRKLEVLSLGGCHGITDRSLGCLEIMCCTLQGLNLQHCRGITSQGVSSFKAALWWCDLLY